MTNSYAYIMKSANISTVDDSNNFLLLQEYIINNCHIRVCPHKRRLSVAKMGA